MVLEPIEPDGKNLGIGRIFKAGTDGDDVAFGRVLYPPDLDLVGQARALGVGLTITALSRWI
jgi:hypothetical protein